MEVSFREIEHGLAEYAAACVLRNDLLRRPLGMDLFDEDLNAESEFVHVAGFDAAGLLVAYLQFKPVGDGVLKMQQVVVAERLQHKGIGRQLVNVSECAARDRGAGEIVLHAREPVVGFYEALGYRCEGEPFLEIGIPHFRMRKGIG